MSLSELRESELREVFNALEEGFQTLGIDFYLIGAIARDFWFSGSRNTNRRTRDVDFAVLVASQEEYLALRDYLKLHKQFLETKENAFVMLAPGNIQVDILPFGAIEISDSIHFKGEGLTAVQVNGFSEVHQSGTSLMKLQTGHHFRIATLPSIVLLKLIAFDDRPEFRTKDARDIANIIEHYFDLQADFIYDNHHDLFIDENDGQSLQQIAATVIGREMQKICVSNLKLTDRIVGILQRQIETAGESSFVRNMVTESKRDVAQSVQFLQKILIGFSH